MADQETIKDVFDVLESSGFKRPIAWDDPRKVKLGLIAYGAVFRNVGNEETMAATMAFVESGEKFWPQPGVLKQYTTAATISSIDQSDEAWGETISMLGSKGRNYPPGSGWEFDGTDLHRAACKAGIAAAGGWRALSMQDEGAMAPERAAFRSAYRSTISRKQIVEQHASINQYLEGRPSIRLLVNKGTE
jgi:hypothetical protein